MTSYPLIPLLTIFLFVYNDAEVMERLLFSNEVQYKELFDEGNKEENYRKFVEYKKCFFRKGIIFNISIKVTSRMLMLELKFI